ncbi:hypothetical protein NDU88_003003 [Pleurodeles waltl]|uniref:Uncharacterized protein n=1 Tax=Pleurodeles waltl TaxID=8319 RepID=A0AAV7VF55_PLEWA|nr:hypothetical protein NDU88_003003 [Pleurodeles waltl]
MRLRGAAERPRPGESLVRLTTPWQKSPRSSPAPSGHRSRVAGVEGSGRQQFLPLRPDAGAAGLGSLKPQIIGVEGRRYKSKTIAAGFLVRTPTPPTLSMAEETWQWIDMQKTEEGDCRPENFHPERKRKSRHSKAGRMGSPSPMEILKERQKAMEAAASLSGSDRGSVIQAQEEQDSELSHSSDRIGPDVTPGASDCTI